MRRYDKRTERDTAISRAGWSLVALKPGKTSKGFLARAVKLTARGKVLDAIEKLQRFKDGETCLAPGSQESQQVVAVASD